MNIKLILANPTDIVITCCHFGSKIGVHFEGTRSLDVFEIFGGIAAILAPYSHSVNRICLQNRKGGL